MNTTVPSILDSHYTDTVHFRICITNSTPRPRGPVLTFIIQTFRNIYTAGCGSRNGGIVQQNYLDTL